MTGDIHPTLRRNASDFAAMGLRALTSTVDQWLPGGGSFFGELIAEVIPNTTSRRLLEYVTRLGRQLAALEARVDDLGQLDTEQLALFEDGARSSVRATTPNRIERVARIVAHSWTKPDVDAERSRIILALLDQLSENDLLALDQYIHRMGPDPRRGANSPSDYPDVTGLGFAEANAIFMAAKAQSDDRAAIEMHRLTKLIGMNLLEQPVGLMPGRPLIRGGQGLPQIAKEQPRLTRLGKLVLEEAGLGQPTWEEVLIREQDASKWLGPDIALTPER